MPHIIVEYAEQLADETPVETMLETVHHSVAESGLFEESHIKTRAYPFRYFTKAGRRNPYIHVQARIKSGRNEDNKKRFAEVILIGLRELNIPASVITIEIIDMDRGSYSKYEPK